MKTNHTFKWLMLASMLLVMGACQQEELTVESTEEGEKESLQEIAVSEAEIDDVLQTWSEAESDRLDMNSGGRASRFPCATITWIPEEQTLIIDFGDGCVGPRGRFHSGKIIIKYSSVIGDDMANLIITFEDYHVNRKGISVRLN